MRSFLSKCFVTGAFAAGALLWSCSTHSDKLDVFHSLTAHIDRYTKQIEEKQAEVNDVLVAYNQTVPKGKRLHLPFESAGQFAPREQALLRSRIEHEDDPSCRSILEHVSDLNTDVGIIKEKVAAIYEQLPPPYIAQGGEDHRAVCERFLRKECGLSASAADSALAGVPLLSNLVEGFNVWCIYENGEFATFVGKGSACISPACYSQREKDAAFERPVAHVAVDTSEQNITSFRGLIGSAATPVSLK